MTTALRKPYTALLSFPYYPAKEAALMDGLLWSDENQSSARLAAALANGVTIDELEEFFPERPQ